ncbi:glucose 1-dehydrogenase [Sodalis sp. dw_96]|uniref:SDR family NAD(P)-dependent oxidoreductase n=1 Tax=Sodalis sp. dw_96 TaxID=2719794 RepID=UPI001BD223CC|nr:glucose 1-dehydrogenase [Sodalis sp. dw_96]
MRYFPGFRLDNKIAVVTGASKGLGETIAHSLAESGATVAIVARDKAMLEQVARTAKEEYGGLMFPFQADLIDIQGFDRLVSQIEAEVGAIDILVNNAGTNIQQSATDVDEQTWDYLLDLNLKSVFFLSQAVGRRMLDAKRPGRIINIASQIGEVGFYKRSAYAASKGGLVHMSKVMAIEWAEQGIRVNCVGPTFVDTPLLKIAFQDREIAEEVMRRIPIKRLGRPSEVAAAVVYLASEGADLVTGHHLLVDGGWTAQ